MMRALLLMIVGGLVFSAPVQAGDTEFSFSFDGAGGTIDDDFVSFFSLQMDSDAQGLPSINEITSLQLTITGLTHETPEDLDIFLLSPSFTGDRGRILIMSDKGGMTDLNGVTLTFSDGADPLPMDGDPLASGIFQTEGLTNQLQELTLGADAGFSSFIGGSGGNPLDWILVFVDDSPRGLGTFESFTLSGTAVPEPVTLSLLALGALMTLRRKRR